jgi:WD40 repeat protein
MHTHVSLFLLLALLLLSACGPASNEPLPASSIPALPATPSLTTILSQAAPEQTPSTSHPTPILTSTQAYLPTDKGQEASHVPPDRPMIAYQAASEGNMSLLLVDPADHSSYKINFPSTTHFATPFLAGLSPDARYFVTFEGGRLETLYEVEHLRASTPALELQVHDLRSGEIIFSAQLLSPAFPQDLDQLAETIKDEWYFTFQNATFTDVVTAIQEMLLDNIRNVAWSPDSSLLAYASQDPGPSSDLCLFRPEDRVSQCTHHDPAHVLKITWAPDSTFLYYTTSLYDRHAREDNNYILSRVGSLRASFTSQVWFFKGWLDSANALLIGGTDSGDYFEPKLVSAADGKITTFWEGSFEEIAISPDRSTFLFSSNMPSAPLPPHPGLFLGKLDDGSLQPLSENLGWRVAYWGSEPYAFAASSIEEGTLGITSDGEYLPIDPGYWRFAASSHGSYLAGYQAVRPGYLPGVKGGLRIFDSSGMLVESGDDINVTCVGWNAAGTALAYQVGNQLFLWEATAGSSRYLADDLNEQGCAFTWVGEHS